MIQLDAILLKHVAPKAKLKHTNPYLTSREGGECLGEGVHRQDCPLIRLQIKGATLTLTPYCRAGLCFGLTSLLFNTVHSGAEHIAAVPWINTSTVH